MRPSSSEVNNEALFSRGKQHNGKHKLFDGAGAINLNVRFKGVGLFGEADCLALAHLAYNLNIIPAL